MTQSRELADGSAIANLPFLHDHHRKRREEMFRETLNKAMFEISRIADGMCCSGGLQKYFRQLVLNRQRLQTWQRRLYTEIESVADVLLPAK